MDINKIPSAHVVERFIAPSGTTGSQQDSPKDGELYVDTETKTLKVAVGGSYQQMVGLPIGDEQTASGTVVGGYLYPVNTSNGSITLTIKAGQDANTRVGFFDPEGSWGDNSFTVQGDGETINGSSGTLVFSLSNASVTYVKSTGSRGWHTLMSTGGNTEALKGWGSIISLTDSATLVESKAYLLDLNATITFAGSTVSKLNVSYSRKSGTRDFGDLTTTGDYYWQNADNTDIMVGHIEVNDFKGWVIGESNSSDTYVAQRGGAPIASPLGVETFQSAAENTFNDDIVSGGFVQGNYTFTLPDSATDKSAIFVGDQYGACGHGTTVTISSSTQSFGLNEPYQYMVFQYDEENTQWLVTRGGVLNHVSGDSNTPETISLTSVNNNTGYQHTHELSKASSDEVSTFSSSEVASLEQIRQALALKGIAWDPNNYADYAPLFPESSVNSITVPAGDYFVNSMITDTPEESGVMSQRYISTTVAVQLFQGAANNTLYIRNYPTTTDWLQLALKSDVTALEESISTLLATAEEYASDADHLTSGTVASARMASATTDAQGAVILSTDTNANDGSGDGVISATQLNNYATKTLTLNQSTQSTATFSEASNFAKPSGWSGFVNFTNGTLSADTDYHYKVLGRNPDGGYGSLAMDYSTGITYSIKAATSDGEQTVRQLVDLTAFPEATDNTLSDTFQLWSSNLIDAIVSANSDVTDHSSALNTLSNTVSSLSTAVGSNTTATATNTSSLATLSTTVSNLSDTVSGNSDDISSVTSTANANASSIDTLSDTVSGHTTTLSSLSDKVTTNTSDINTLSDTVSDHTSSLSTLSDAVDTNTSGLSALSDKVTTNTSDISSLSDSVDTNTSGLSSLTETVNTNTSDISSLSDTVSSNSSSLTSLTSTVSDLSDTVSSLSSSSGGDDSDLESAVNTNTSDISSLTDTVNTNTSSISSLSDSVSSNTSSISDLSDSVDSLTTDMTTVKEEVASNTTDISDLQETVSELSSSSGGSSSDGTTAKTYLFVVTSNQYGSDYSEKEYTFASNGVTLPAGTYAVMWTTYVYGKSTSGSKESSGSVTPRVYNSDGDVIASGSDSDYDADSDDEDTFWETTGKTFTLTEETKVYLGYYVQHDQENSHCYGGAYAGSFARIDGPVDSYTELS